MQKAPTPAPASATGEALSSLHACLIESTFHLLLKQRIGAVDVQHHTPDLIYCNTHCN